MKYTVKISLAALFLAAVLFPSGNCLAQAGAWEAKSFNTNQLAPLDGFVVATAYWSGGGKHTLEMKGYTDASANPTTLRQISGYRVAQIFNGITVGSYTANFTMPVRKGDYWRVDISGDYTKRVLYWISWPSAPPAR
jgi:hypothetical protein